MQQCLYENTVIARYIITALDDKAGFFGVAGQVRFKRRFEGITIRWGTMTISVHWPALAGVIHPNIGGWAGAVITRRNINPWYESLKKPSWTPPKWAFGPAWTSIYCSVGYASYLVYRDGGGFEGAALPLSIYGANLALNWAWTPIFFGCHNIKIALCEIVVLWGSTVALAVAFHQVNPVAGYLVLPYIAWTTFATALNYVIYRDNKETPAIEDKKN